MDNGERRPGTIMSPASVVEDCDFSERDFGRFFRPDGVDVTYSTLRYIDKGVKDSKSAYYSARGRAVRAFLRHSVEFSVPIEGEWTGAWQEQ